MLYRSDKNRFSKLSVSRSFTVTVYHISFDFEVKCLHSQESTKYVDITYAYKTWKIE